MRGTKAKLLMRLVKQGVAALDVKPAADVEGKFWYRKIKKVVGETTIERMGSWFRHPESTRARYQRAKMLYKKGMLNV